MNCNKISVGYQNMQKWLQKIKEYANTLKKRESKIAMKWKEKFLYYNNSLQRINVCFQFYKNIFRFISYCVFI